MYDLKTRRQKLETVQAGGKTPAAIDPFSVSEVIVRPRRDFAFGRHLSFSTDDGSIQMAAVSHVGPRKKILEVRKVYVPDSLRDTPGQREFIAETIDEFLSEFGGRWLRVSVVLSGKETAFRTFLMPVLKRRELDSAVRFEAKKQIPFPLEDSIINYRRVYKVTGERQARYKVGLQAATKRLVKDALEPFRRRNIDVAAVYHGQDVIGQLLAHLPDFNPEAHATVINIARTHCEISFFRGANLQFYHIGPVGSSLLGSQVDSIGLEIFAKTLATEIQTTLDFYAGQYPGSAMDRVLVYGDLAYSDELLELLNGDTGMQFERFPTHRLDFVPGGKPRFAEALPACLPVLAAAVCETRLANLLPEEDQLRRANRKMDRQAQAFILLLVLGLVIGWALAKKNTAVAENNLKSLTRQVNSFKESPAFHTYNVLKRQIASYRAYVERIRKLPSYLNLNLKELSLLTPPAIRLLNLEYKPEGPGNNFTIRGLATSSDIPPEIILAEYVESLDNSPFFEDVTLNRYVKRRTDGTFEMEFQVSMKGTM